MTPRLRLGTKAGDEKGSNAHTRCLQYLRLPGERERSLRLSLQQIIAHRQPSRHTAPQQRQRSLITTARVPFVATVALAIAVVVTRRTVVALATTAGRWGRSSTSRRARRRTHLALLPVLLEFDQHVPQLMVTQMHLEKRCQRIRNGLHGLGGSPCHRNDQRDDGQSQARTSTRRKRRRHAAFGDLMLQRCL